MRNAALQKRYASVTQALRTLRKRYACVRKRYACVRKRYACVRTLRMRATVAQQL